MRAARRRPALWVLVGVLVVALTMRGPIIAVAPVVKDLRAGLHAGPATVSLLTTIPVLCFALGTPLALAAVRRYGLDSTVLVGLAGTLAGVLLRSVAGIPGALAGTLVLGLGITIGNVVIPVVIGRDFPGRTTSVTAAYSSALNVGSMIATTASAPLAALAGWRVALAAWAAVTVVAALVWRVVTGSGPSRVPRVPRAEAEAEVAEEVAPPPGPLWRRPLVVGMVLAFGGQSFSYYGVSAWLPSLLGDELGLSAGAAGASASIFQITAVAGAFAIPALVAARMPARRILLLVCACWVALPLGLLLAPGLWPLWSVFGGVAQGGGFTVIFSVVVARARDLHDSRRMSATVQGVGYCAGATGPLLVGLAHSLSGGWHAPMLVVAAAVVIMALGGSWAIGAGRPQPRTTPA